MESKILEIKRVDKYYAFRVNGDLSNITVPAPAYIICSNVGSNTTKKRKFNFLLFNARKRRDTWIR